MTARTRWEYRLEIVEITGKDDHATARAETVAFLDELGADGWEATGFTPSHASSHGLRVETTQYLVLLKRPRPA